MRKLKTFILLICLMIPCFFVACSNENKNIMSVPTELTVATGGKITFERVANEEYYVISVNNLNINVFPNTNANVELYSVDNVNYLEYDASKVFALGESYSVKVKACATDKKDSDYTTPVSYKHTLPVEKPLNTQINGLTLTWEPVENASFYRVKVLTPTDKTDKDDSETIAGLDLTAYQFSTNKFDFASILTSVGEYKFYVNAVSLDKNYTESGYTTKMVYTHKLTLDTPTSVSVHKVNELDTASGQYVDNLHLVAVLDKNANAITLSMNSVSRKYELSQPNDAISMTDNFIDINLNQLLEHDFSDLTRYQFTLQCNYTSASETNKFYNDSTISSVVSYDNYAKISRPVVQVEYDALNDTNVAYWGQEDDSELANVAGYVLYLHKATGVIQERVGTDVNSRILTSDITAVSIRALGKGNYISSELSDTVSHYEETSEQTVEFVVEGTIISWTDVADYYLIELDDQIISVVEPQLDLTTLDLTLGKKELKVIVVADGYMPFVASYDFEYSIRLATPSGCGFVNNNPYLLTFTGVNNAIGYQIYLNDEKVETVYTTTAIDLSKYVIKTGEYNNYTVKVQAIADKYSGYKDSECSAELIVSHTKVLDKPQFRKDSDGDDAPIVKKVEGGQISYYLSFYGVDYAVSYEVMINFNKITVMNDNRDDLYELDVTDYLSAANRYTITVRAIPISDGNIKPSEKNSYDYVLRLQLDPVTDIKWAENEGVITLSFDLQDDAKEYSIYIVKVNDNNYNNYLYSQGLTNSFKVAGATDITAYVKEAGLYQIYVTAIADPSGGYYADSDESSEYAEINKLTTLDIPTNIQFNNKSENEYLVRWSGDDNADYYILRVTDVKGNIMEYKTASNETTYNINDSYTIEGFYSIRIKSMITPNSDNSKTHQSSGYCETVIDDYRYNQLHDYKRHSVFMYGDYYDFYIEDVNDLMYILWYHVLYGIEDAGLKLYLNLDSTASETVIDAINRLALEANDTLFDSNNQIDISWEGYNTDEDKFKYLVTKLLELYPEMKVITNISCEHTTGTQTFTLGYANALDVTKEYADISTSYGYTKDYGNKYNYLANSARRNASATFAIDSCEYIEVTTTEQLVMAVQYGKQPRFVGDSDVAEAVYHNAREVLLSIANNTMSEYEKTIAIFDWLEYAVDLNYYADRNVEYFRADFSDYGKRRDYYLEAIFLDLNNSSAGAYDDEFYLGNVRGTSESYAKAFTLLCAIEGIEVRKVNGTYTYTYGSSTYTIDHTWNKVYLELAEEDDGAWYALDLMLSDNSYVYYEKTVDKSLKIEDTFATVYGMSSHAYFLVTDAFLSNNLNIIEDAVMARNVANTSFDYYINANFSLEDAEVRTLFNKNTYAGFSYSKRYDANYSYNDYSFGLSTLQAYIANAVVYADYQLNFVSDSKVASFEIKISGVSQTTVEDEITSIITNTINKKIPTEYRTTEVETKALKGEGNSIIYICTIKQ